MYTLIRKINPLRRYFDKEFWFVLNTQPNFEKIIDKKLKTLGFKTFLPLQKELRQWNEQKVWIETPLFRSYIFIKTNLKKIDRAFDVNGILDYVRLDSELAILSEQDIKRIKKICSYQGKINIEFENLEAGSKVEICEGTLKGLIGFLSNIKDNWKIQIHIQCLNCFASMTINADTISLKYI